MIAVNVRADFTFELDGTIFLDMTPQQVEEMGPREFKKLVTSRLKEMSTDRKFYDDTKGPDVYVYDLHT